MPTLRPLSSTPVINASETHLNPVFEDASQKNQAAFVSELDQLFQTAGKEKWCLDYFVGQVNDLSQKNPDTAQALGLPSDPWATKQWVLDRMPDASAGTCKETALSPEEKFVQCLNDSKLSVGVASTACGLSIALLPPLHPAALVGVGANCGSLALTVLDCAI